MLHFKAENAKLLRNTVPYVYMYILDVHRQKALSIHLESHLSTT